MKPSMNPWSLAIATALGLAAWTGALYAFGVVFVYICIVVIIAFIIAYVATYGRRY